MGLRIGSKIAAETLKGDGGREVMKAGGWRQRQGSDGGGEGELGFGLPSRGSRSIRKTRERGRVRILKKRVGGLEFKKTKKKKIC